MSWLFFLHLSQYNKEEIWCPISSRPQYKESDFCPVTIMHFHHHEFSRSVDPPLSVLSNPQKVSAVLPVRSFPPGPHQQRASLRFDSFFSECSPASLEFVVGDRRRSSQDHGGQNYLPDASLTRLFTLLLFSLILLLAQQFVERRRHTPRREGQKKKFLCIYITSRFRRGGGGGGGGRQWAPWVSDIWAWRTCAQEPYERDYGGKIGLLHQRDVKCNVLLS